MRIVDRKTFLAMPAGTVFMKFPDQPKDASFIDLGVDDALHIKWDTASGDFVSQSLVPYFEGWTSGFDWGDVMTSLLKGERSPPVDYDCAGRDGLFDEGQLFLVWDRADHRALIDLLQGAYDALPAGET